MDLTKNLVHMPSLITICTHTHTYTQRENKKFVTHIMSCAHCTRCDPSIKMATKRKEMILVWNFYDGVTTTIGSVSRMSRLQTTMTGWGAFFYCSGLIRSVACPCAFGVTRLTLSCIYLSPTKPLLQI